MTFTQHWHSRVVSTWTKMFTALGWIGKPDLRFLEVGCYEGQATVWLLENILTHPTSRIEVVDTFRGNPEFEGLGVDATGILERFKENVRPFGEKVNFFETNSIDWLCQRQFAYVEDFDFIYLDGSHRACDVLADAFLSWPLLKPKGILIFDDLAWTWDLPTGEKLIPGDGIRAFLSVFKGQYERIMEAGDQLGIRKI